MATDKKSVLLYCDIIHTVEKLDDVTAGLLFKHYLRYVNDLNPETDNILVDLAFESIKQQLKRDLKKWEGTLEDKSKSGILGNLKRWHLEIYNRVVSNEITLEEGLVLSQTIAENRTPIKSIANIAVTVTDTVIDNVIVKVKDTNNILLSEIEISDVEVSQVEYFKIALKFQQLFIKNLKANQAPTTDQEKATFKNYVTPIRLMFEIDKITKEQLLLVYKFLDSTEGDFWKSNILSTKKLREKFSQLVIKSKTNGTRVNSTATKTASTYNRSKAIGKAQAFISLRNRTEEN